MEVMMNYKNKQDYIQFFSIFEIKVIRMSQRLKI
jgi:hypothetical protein